MCRKSKFHYGGQRSGPAYRRNGLIYMISFVLVLGLAGASAAEEIDPSLVGWWKLNEDFGSTAIDWSGHDNHGSLVGDPQWVSGYIGGTLDFDGDGDYIDCGYDPIFDITDEITLAAWVNIRSIPVQWVSIVTKGEYAWRLSNVESDPRFHFGITIWSDANPSVNGSTAVGYNEWHHVAGTHDGSELNLYLDGVPDGTLSSTTAIGTNTANLFIGENPEAAGRYWDGLIDDVRLYNRALSQTEINELMPLQPRATAPEPYDKAILVTTEVTLSWIPGDGAASHYLYFGENFEDVQNGTEGTDKGLTNLNNYSPQSLETGKTYYWRVDEVEADGTTTHTGDVWSFTIPSKYAYNPVPPDSAEFIDPNVTLSWAAGTGSIIHFVYFGDNLEDVQAGTGGTNKGSVTTDPNYIPGPLEFAKTYYWRIDEFDGMRRYTGDVWSFTTVGPTNGAKGQYYNNVDLTGQPVLTRIDPKIDFTWGEDSPHDLVNANNFSVRWTAELDVPFTETYTFYTLSDDCVRLWIDGELIIDNWTVVNAWAIEDKGVIDLVAGQVFLKMEFFDSDGAASVQLRWQSPSLPRQIISPSALSQPLSASGGRPDNGATEIRQIPTLRWTAGDQAAQHDVYFGIDETAVNNADTTTPDIYRGRQDLENTTYIPTEAPLLWGQTYYWRIDEVEADGVTINKGRVWSFTVADYAVVEDFEYYNDDDNRIYHTWSDYAVNNTGMTVGHFEPPYAEQSIVHGGYQAMYMHYDNDGTVNEGTAYEQSGTLTFSEVERQWDDPQDWTINGVNSLTLWFRGTPASVGSFTEGPPITMTANGTDIWDTADEFHFAYKRLSGAGSITAKVLSVSNTNSWAKAGVMIRQSLEPGSLHAAMVVTPGSGVSFQRRMAVNGGSEETSQDDITAPQWVRLIRAGNSFIGQYSANGATWTTLETVNMPILLDVYVGLCLTSHNVDETCTAEFSDVTISGTVTGDWLSQDIGIKSNIAEPMYVVLADSADNSALVNHPDPAASIIGIWTQWNIPFADFAGVNMQAIKKISIGVGDRASTQPGTAGDLYIDDIGLYLPTPEPEPEPSGAS